MDSYDMQFFEMVLKAGRSLRKVQNKEPLEAGLQLAEYLRSDKPLERGERELLAQLVTGEMRNPSKPVGRNKNIRSAVEHIMSINGLNKADAVRMFIKENGNYTFEQVYRICTR
jgi:hypothetical protein